MARPTRRIITSGLAAWDADVDENFSLIVDTPFPMAQYATVGDLPAASIYEECLAMVGPVIYISDGTSWSLFSGGTAANVADSTATTAADMATDFNELLASLQTAGIMNAS